MFIIFVFISYRSDDVIPSVASAPKRPRVYRLDFPSFLNDPQERAVSPARFEDFDAIIDRWL